MQVKATLAPGQNGTRQLVQQYGNQLVCVRYRYDKTRQKRIKTIALIVDEQGWIPGVIISIDRPEQLKIGFGEAELRQQVKKYRRRLESATKSLDTRLSLGTENGFGTKDR